MDEFLKIKNKISSILLIISSLFAVSCNLFETRSPEEPDTSRSNYDSPVSYDLVIKNFVNSIEDNNTDNYVKCLLDSTQFQSKKFNFAASQDLYNTYKPLFESWGLANERIFFNSMKNSLPNGSHPVLTLTNNKLDDKSSDYVIYSADYNLNLNFQSKTYKTLFTGRLQFLISRSQLTNLWYIEKWSDYLIPNDTIKATFSLLKAQFSN